MSVRTVRLDDETAEALAHIVECTGLSRTEALKQGLLALRAQLVQQASPRPYDLYAALDLGPGGAAIAPSTETQRGVREALRRKLGR